MHFMAPHLSFLGEVLNVEICVMGVPNGWMMREVCVWGGGGGLVGAELEVGGLGAEVVCMGWRVGCSRLLWGRCPRLVKGHSLDMVWYFCWISCSVRRHVLVGTEVVW